MMSIRGAVAPVKNTAETIGQAALDLITQICKANQITAEDIILLLFTCTQDLTSAYPAKAVRESGFTQVPMLCVQEMKVENSLSGCIRVLMLVDNLKVANHVYLGEAKELRRDWVGD